MCDNNNIVKTTLKILLVSLFFISLSSIPQVAAQKQSIDEFILNIQNSLNQKNIQAYLENFFGESREKEEIKHKIDQFQIDNVRLFKASKLSWNGDEAGIYLQALFQNSYSVVRETWHLKLLEVEGRWQIKEKKVTGAVNTLYRVQIPSARVERVKSIEIENVDIKISFNDAILFYDNIPEMETALLVVGKGRLFFSPSDPIEKHQLEILYKRNFLQDELTYAYLRFSDHFFQNNIKIKKETSEKNFQASPSDRNKAYSLFFKHYPRSFTIENSLNGELLSSLPQGDETVIGFNGKKLGNFTYIYSPFSEEEINLYRWKDKRSIILYSPLTDVKKKKLFITFGEMFEVKRYQIDIDFKPRRSFISGKAIVEIESSVDNLTSVKFKLNPGLDVLRIYDEERRELFYSRDKLRDILYVYFIRPPPQKKPYSLEIFYRGKIELPAETADIVTGPYIHDRSGQYYDLTYNFLPSRPDTFLFSKSSKWYPSPPNDDDYFKARLRVIVPPKYLCISNGELIEQSRLNEVEKVEEIETTGNSVYVFETKIPLKYISFIVGKFITVGEDFDSIPFRHFYAPGVSFQRKGLLNTAKNIVQFYESKFGLFPYEKLTIVRRPWITTGGHSPASFIVINELHEAQDGTLFVNTGSPVDLSRWKEYFMAHEIAHQWWGQSITLKTYHDQWLSEGLAQFASILYLKEKYGDRVFSYILKKFSQWSEKKSKWGPIILGSRLSYHDFKAYQAIIYNKTSLVLNMLKDILGEELFFQGLKEFFEKYKYSSASTHDFIRTFEEISGKDLTLFFKKWFYSWVLPEVKISHSLQEGEEGYILKLKITQLKDTFVFPLQIEWKENGEKVRKQILIDEKNEEFEFQLSAKPRKIKINPDKAVPGKFR